MIRLFGGGGGAAAPPVYGSYTGPNFSVSGTGALFQVPFTGSFFTSPGAPGLSYQGDALQVGPVAPGAYLLTLLIRYVAPSLAAGSLTAQIDLGGSGEWTFVVPFRASTFDSWSQVAVDVVPDVSFYGLELSQDSGAGMTVAPLLQITRLGS